MTNWLITLVNTIEPFDTIRTIVNAETIVEAFDEKNHGHPSYWPRSAQFHSVAAHDHLIYSDHSLELFNHA